MDPTKLEQRLQKLEEVATHQEHLLQQLNDVVVQLRGEHELLQARFHRQLSRLETLIESQASPLDPNERPPHY